jgi:hypothetical protein
MPEQTIFCLVLNFGYIALITRDLNTRSWSFTGYAG